MRYELDIRPLDLDLTLGCGQTFRWRRADDGSWSGPINDQLVKLNCEDGRLVAEVQPGTRGCDEAIWQYLRGDDDLQSILSELGRRDPVIAGGLGRFSGLRLVKMEPWECVLSYILATNANIPRIAGMIDTVSRTYGERITGDVYAFPTPSDMSGATRKALAACGLGYRAEYVHSLIRTIDNRSLERMKALDYERLRNVLMEVQGVGPKVSDCVALFGFGKLGAFPVDVWIRRALNRLYEIDGSYETLRRFAAERFGRYAGFAQEYLYHNERILAKDGGCAFGVSRHPSVEKRLRARDGSSCRSQ